MIGWTIGFVFLCIVRGVGTVELGSVQFDLWTSILVSLIFGPLFGTISGFGQIFLEKKIYKRTSIRKLLILRVLYATLFLALLIIVFYFITRQFFGVNISLVEFAFEPGSFAIYFYILSIDFFMVVLRQVNLLLGNKKLAKLLMGMFYHPREEERIFMFLDLQSSTRIAEKLGHIRYSRLIQDCFNDLGVVSENEAEIYQYVGDEVVLTWTLKQGLLHQNCVLAFFNFKERLEGKKRYYQEQYQCNPFFKAGMNCGMVTVSEIGKYKKEIAYHGDTLNTAARIQAKCNQYGKELLISEQMMNQLSPNGFSFEKIGSIVLRGKQEETAIYAVEKGH